MASIRFYGNALPPLAHLTHVADHIEHEAKVAGFDDVGIAGGFYNAKGDDLVTAGLQLLETFATGRTGLAVLTRSRPISHQQQ